MEIRTHKQDQEEQLELIRSAIVNQDTIPTIVALLHRLPYSYFNASAAQTRTRTKLKVELAKSLLSCEEFKEVRDRWNDQILTAILMHDGWEHDSAISREYYDGHAYSGAEDIKRYFKLEDNQFAQEVAELIRSHEGVKITSLKYPHMAVPPETIAQKFVYYVVQAIDSTIFPNLIHAQYRLSLETSKADTYLVGSGGSA